MIGDVIAGAALGLLFACGLLSLLDILGGPPHETPRGWVLDPNSPPPPVGTSLLGEDEP